jgi:hypothetical protein
MKNSLKKAKEGDIKMKGLNDAQFIALQDKANAVVGAYNEVLRDFDREMEKLKKEYQKKIDSLRDKAITLSDGVLSIYMESDKSLIIDFCDELNPTKKYLTLCPFHQKNKDDHKRGIADET